MALLENNSKKFLLLFCFKALLLNGNCHSILSTPFTLVLLLYLPEYIFVSVILNLTFERYGQKEK